MKNKKFLLLALSAMAVTGCSSTPKAAKYKNEVSKEEFAEKYQEAIKGSTVAKVLEEEKTGGYTFTVNSITEMTSCSLSEKGKEVNKIVLNDVEKQEIKYNEKKGILNLKVSEGENVKASYMKAKGLEVEEKQYQQNGEGAYYFDLEYFNYYEVEEFNVAERAFDHLADFEQYVSVSAFALVLLADEAKTYIDKNVYTGVYEMTETDEEEGTSQTTKLLMQTTVKEDGFKFIYQIETEEVSKKAKGSMVSTTVAELTFKDAKVKALKTKNFNLREAK